MYKAPTTDAQQVNIVTGALQPIPADRQHALILFSSDSDVNSLRPLIQNLAGVSNFEDFDGQGIVCPPIQYGSDGRKVNCFQFNYQSPQGGDPVLIQDSYGVVLAQKYWGSAWNWGRQAPYTALFLDTTPSLTQLNWGH